MIVCGGDIAILIATKFVTKAESGMISKHLSIALLLCVAGSGLALVLAKRSRQTTDPAEWNAAVQSGSLREKARLKGSYTVTAQPKPMQRYNDATSIAKASTGIVLGTVDSSRTQLLPPAEKFIVTDCQVRLTEVLKGDFQPDQVISLRLPGGFFQFEDGTFAEVKMPDFWKKPEIGKSYVFFVEKRQAGHFVLHGGPQGMFEITSDGVVKPQVRQEDELMRNYNDKDVGAFLKEIRQATTK
jgi:hypothetical protein